MLVVLPETVNTSPLFPIHDGIVYTAPSLDKVGGINFILWSELVKSNSVNVHEF